MTHVDIQVCSKISPHELMLRRGNGYWVQRTAHLGNQYPSNLFLAALGMPFCLYDKTLLWRDQNYHPSQRISGSVPKPVVSQEKHVHGDTLVPFAIFGDGSLLKQQWHTPAHYHFRTFAGLFPGIVTTESELFLRHEEKLCRVLMLMQERALVGLHRERMPAINRYVMECGCLASLDPVSPDTVRARCGHDIKEVRRADLAEESISLLRTLRGLVFEPETTVQKSGAVPSLALAQAIFMMIGWWESGKSDLYELSGPDLVKYGSGRTFVAQIRSVFEAIESSGTSDLGLPPALTLNIVPTADLRFGYIAGHAPSTLVFELYQCLLRLQRTKRSTLGKFVPRRFCADGSYDRRIEQRFATARCFQSSLGEMKMAIQSHACRWDPLYDIAKAAFFSHHDLEPGQQLVIPDFFLDMQFRAMGKFVEHVRALMKSR